MRSLLLCALLAVAACSDVSAVRMRSMRTPTPTAQAPVTSLEGHVLPSKVVAEVFAAQQALDTDLPVNPDYSPVVSGRLQAAKGVVAKPVVAPAVQIAEAILASPVAQAALADRVHEENVKKLNELPAGATKPTVWQSADGSIYRMDSKGFPILDTPQSGITNAVLRIIKEDKELKEGWAAQDALRKADYAAQQAAQAAQQQQQAAAFAQAQAIAVAQQQAAAQAAAVKAAQNGAAQAAANQAAAAQAAAAQAAAARAAAAAAAAANVKPAAPAVVPTPAAAAPSNPSIVGSIVKTWQDARAAWQQFGTNVKGVGQAVNAAFAQPQKPIQLTAQLEASLPGLSAQLSKQLNIQLLELPRIEEGTVEAPMTFVEVDAETEDEDHMSEEEQQLMEMDSEADALAEVDAEAEAEAEAEVEDEEQLSASSDPKLIFAAARHFRAAAREAAPAEDHPALAGFADQPDPSRVDIQSVDGIQQGFHNPQNQAKVWAVEKQ